MNRTEQERVGKRDLWNERRDEERTSGRRREERRAKKR